MKTTKHTMLPVYLLTDAILRYHYKGCLGNHNKPKFPATTYLFQSSTGIVHFHLGVN
jgi:hypothetical protein